MPITMSRRAYAGMFGPTVGDRVRLGDSSLLIRVEEDLTVYGEEVKFGGGKVIRDGMGQSQMSRADGAPDTVITNALILDHWGIIKADVSIRDGRIAAIGKAGNPDVQPGVTIPIGPGTEIIAGEGRTPITLTIANSGDRPIQVGSHYHFAETNPALLFDRDTARGYRLDIPSGTAVRFEPGQSRDVQLIPYAGDRIVIGFRGDVMGEL